MSEIKKMDDIEQVTASEFKTHFGKYLKLVETTDAVIQITKNGRVIARIMPDEVEEDISDLLALEGIIPDEGQTKESIREERLREKYGLTD
ncbi:type II toxin-antitoxin system Phd/YefM family antitoxin [Eubacteriales bacterium OttesenSCG-928-A19]|nr:type II toxin-antitoxin system Phd/YefM family antitoxin [Eubacteriales bacterium OttesenSCG-928-A19]